MDRVTDVFFKILLVLLPLVAGLTALEFAAGFILKTTRLDQKVHYAEQKLRDDSLRIFSLDPGLGLVYRPGAVGRQLSADFDVEYVINSQGWRDREVPLAKPRGEFRVAALGESTVFGEGIPYGERFTEVIEDSLENVDVINQGVQGFGADQSLLQLEKEGFRFHEDAVILFAIRDLFERCKLRKRGTLYKPRFVLDRRKDGLVLEKGRVAENRFESEPSPSRDTLDRVRGGPGPSWWEKSRLFTLLRSEKRMTEIREALEEKEKSRWTGIHQRLQADAERDAADTGKDFKKLIFLILRQYRDLCAGHSAAFMLVYIDDDKEYFQTWIAPAVQELGIPCLDLSGALRAAARQHPLRFNIDPHFNVFTHRLIGESVTDHLMQLYPLRRNKSYAARYSGTPE